MELTTDRCLIRNLNMNDAGDLYKILSDESVMQYIEPVFDAEQTKTFILSAGMCEPPLVYAIIQKVTNALIGHAIFHPYEESDYEIGWVISKDHWGMGIASEVTHALIAHARHMGIGSCIIECDPRQLASKRIALKCGFAYDGNRENLARYRLIL